MYQDPAFGFRQLVDIAEKALSAAINDPTTAVQAMDRLRDLLLRLAPRPDPSGQHTDDAGHLRFVQPVIGWETFVTLAFEEIRQYSTASVQVHRRLRASARELLEVVAADRRLPLARQLRLLERSASRHFPTPRSSSSRPDGTTPAGAATSSTDRSAQLPGESLPPGWRAVAGHCRAGSRAPDSEQPQRLRQVGEQPVDGMPTASRTLVAVATMPLGPPLKR